MCTVQECDKVGRFWIETEDEHFVSLLCGEHANELVGIALPDTPRYVIVQTLGTETCSILDTRTNKPVTINISLTDNTEINSYSRKVAEKLIEAIELMEIIDNE
jgi:hypothetical protein